MTPFIQWKGWTIVDQNGNIIICDSLDEDERVPYLFTKRKDARDFIRGCIGLTGYKAVPITLGNNKAAGTQQKG